MQKKIIITGASRGLGKAIAELLDGLGHQTFLVSRSQKALQALEKTLRYAQIMPYDLYDYKHVKSVVVAAVKAMQGLDGLVNNAGSIEPITPIRSIDCTAWEKALALNLTTPTMLIKESLPQLMHNRGCILNISSGAAIKPTAGWGSYCSSKAGLLRLTEVVAVEHPEVACFSLRPGVIDTEMQSLIRQSQQGMSTCDHQKFIDLHQDGKLLPPAIPAQAACWLLLHGPLARSGQLIEYADPEVIKGVQELFNA